MKKSSPTQRQPFVISGGRAYYIGITDMKPVSMGYHIKGEMNGLWFPPLRVIKWIKLSIDGEVLKPKTFKMLVNECIFVYQSFYMKMIIHEEKWMSIIVKADQEFHRDLTIELKLGVLPVWFSEKDVDYLVSLNGQGIRIKESTFQKEFIIKSNQSENFTLQKDKIIYKTRQDLSIEIYENVGLSSSQVESEYKRSIDSKEHEGDITALRTNYLISNLQNNIEMAKRNIEKLILEVDGVGRGIVAGFPEFPWFFGIDTYYCGKGLLLSGKYSEYSSTIDMLARFGRRQNGKIPHEIVSNGRIFNAGNLIESIVFPLMVFDLYRWTKNQDYITNNIDLLSKTSIALFNSDLTGRGIMEDPEAGSGIDVDTVCYFITNLQTMEEIAKETGQFSEYLPEFAETKLRWKRFLHKEMWMQEINGFGDRYRDGRVETNGFWTTIVPFVTQLGTNTEFQRFIGSGGSAYKNIKAKNGLKVDQSGKVMFNGNALMVKACLNYGDILHGMAFFKQNDRSIGRYSLDSFPEILNDRSGCFMQAWSACLYIENVLEDIIGIRPQGDSLVLKKVPKIPAIFENLKIDDLKYRNKQYIVRVRDGLANIECT